MWLLLQLGVMYWGPAGRGGSKSASRPNLGSSRGWRKAWVQQTNPRGAMQKPQYRIIRAGCVTGCKLHC